MTVRILALLMLQFAGQQIWAQALPSSSLPIDAYIHQGWDSLSRSMSECKIPGRPQGHDSAGALSSLRRGHAAGTAAAEHRNAKSRLPTCPIASSTWAM